MDPRIETSLTRALATRDLRDLLERAAPAMGLPGVRLRLAVVRELTAAHGGACWVEDAPSGGARFVVELPEGRHLTVVEAA